MNLAEIAALTEDEGALPSTPQWGQIGPGAPQVAHGLPHGLLLEEGGLGAPTPASARPRELPDRMAHGPPDPPRDAL